MKKVISKYLMAILIVIIVGGVIMIPQTVKSEAATSLNLVNGDFETGTIEGWTWSAFSTNGKDVSSKITMGNPPVYDWFGKTNSLVDMGYCKTPITIDEAYTLGSIVYQEKDVSQYLPGSTLTFSADMMVFGTQAGPVGDRGGLTLEYYDKDGKLIKTDETGPIETSPGIWNGKWVSKSISSQIPEGAVTVRAALMAYVGTPNWIDAYFDNALLTITLPAVANPITIEKTVKGDPKNDETFSFELTPDENTFPMPEGTSGKRDVTINGPGTASFGSWNYTAPGVYTYKVREVAGSNAHYTYDDIVYEITDTVTSNDNGDLVLNRAIQTVAGEKVDGILAFTNQFASKPVTSTVLDIEKKVKGEPKTNETFTFELTPDKVSFPMPEGSDGKKEVTIKGPGTATFGSWTYTTSGVYKYHVREVAGVNADYDYDGTVYEITDTVTLNDNGDLVVNRVVQISVGKTVDGVLAFTNQFKPHEEFPAPPEKPEKPAIPHGTPPVQTGDASHPYLFLLLAILSLGMLVALCINTIAKKNDEQTTGRSR